MAKYGPASCFLIVGGRNISGETFELEEENESKTEQTNGLGDAMEEHLPIGVGKVILNGGGDLYDDAVGSTVEALQAKGETLQQVVYGMSGSAIGAECVILNGAFVAKFNRIASKDGLIKAKPTYTVTADPKRARILHGPTAETSDPGNTEGASSYDNGASTAGGSTADLHVLALTLGGFTNVVLKVRHSADDSTYADLITFTAVTTAPQTQRGTSAGTVNRHLAVSWDFTGAGSGQSVTFLIALNRGA